MSLFPSWRKIIRPKLGTDYRLGCPAGNIDFRLNHFAEMTGGKGFRVPAKPPSAQRAAHKAEMRALNRERLKAQQGKPLPMKYRNCRSRHRKEGK
ncbi:hypothetical protein [Stappia indica]|uniref:Uncharacterized protein n=1 Tax=Stappia indica TaxID=538381 RepID=A0A857C4Z3_9HYPH|nr:hypothetical protein [Stappia indica]QGZ33939.1 hypothetical protein GH266_05085 [Stappia indica]